MTVNDQCYLTNVYYYFDHLEYIIYQTKKAGFLKYMKQLINKYLLINAIF